jgi:hypothetical protein
MNVCILVHCTYALILTVLYYTHCTTERGQADDRTHAMEVVGVCVRLATQFRSDQVHKNRTNVGGALHSIRRYVCVCVCVIGTLLSIMNCPPLTFH